MTRARTLSMLAGAALLLGASVSAAAEPEADAALTRGVELRRAHRDAEALASFRRAQELDPTPRALAQVALAEAALSQWVIAEGDLVRALAADDAWIDRQRATLQVALKEIQSHLGSLDVTSAPGAELWIDGALVARLPSPPVRIPTGRVAIELRAAGLVTARRSIDVEAGSITRVAIDLAAEPPSAPAPAIATPPILSIEPPVRSPAAHRTAAWLTLGGATVLVAGGVLFWRAQLALGDRYNDPGACGPRPSDQCADLRDRIHTVGALEATSFALAGLAAATSALLFVTLPRDAGASRARAWCAPTFGGIACGRPY